MTSGFLQTVTSRLIKKLDAMIQESRMRENRKRFYAQAEMDPTVRLGPAATIRNNQVSASVIRIGPHSVIEGDLLTYGHGGRITLGSYVFLGPDSRIWSSTSVNIGNHVLISHNVNIHDNDSHSLRIGVRRMHTEFILQSGALPTTAYEAGEAPVIIEDDVWICLNATILKGVRIGRGAVVGAGAVVTQNVEAFTLVAGNPAVFIKNLERQ